jgi:hypothetical protein
MMGELLLTWHIFYHVATLVMLAVIMFYVARLARPRQGMLLSHCPTAARGFRGELRHAHAADGQIRWHNCAKIPGPLN